jgi:hypothetical protein
MRWTARWPPTAIGIVAGDYVIDEERGSGIVMAGFPPEEHVAVVCRVRDGLIHDVILFM